MTLSAARVDARGRHRRGVARRLHPADQNRVREGHTDCAQYAASGELLAEPREARIASPEAVSPITGRSSQRINLVEEGGLTASPTRADAASVASRAVHVSDRQPSAAPEDRGGRLPRPSPRSLRS